ncbi:hypothetical protein DVH24_024052 [Malus domestica]|uniref:Uncharacterized protein n=1 Tax=Malus domestica TaxID=3750 RepID=A0A498JFB4_MALDO|nr:hypothetical protein DVH24_024052 [Malus domestica]
MDFYCNIGNGFDMGCNSTPSLSRVSKVSSFAGTNSRKLLSIDLNSIRVLLDPPYCPIFPTTL